METIHAQVPLRGKPGIAFDEKLEPLLAAFVRRGCETAASCQDERGDAYIMFRDGESLRRAVVLCRQLTEVAQDWPLWCGILKHATHPDSPIRVAWEEMWRYEVRPAYYLAGRRSEELPVEFQLLDLTVRFATGDLELLSRYLHEHRVHSQRAG